MKTFIIGVGSPFLSDDSVGLWVVKELKEKINDPSVTVDESAGDWLGLLDMIAGYDKVIIVDAIQTKGGKPGKIYRLSPDDFTSMGAVSIPHNISLPTALELGRRLNLQLPLEIIIYAVEADDITTFSEQCTPKVADAVPRLVKKILSEL